MALDPELEQNVSQKLIASCLGISPEFLSVLKRDRVARGGGLAAVRTAHRM